MSQIANITLKTDATTGTVVLNPQFADAKSCAWIDRSTIGSPRVLRASASWVDPSATRKTTRVDLKVVLPVSRTLGQEQLSYDLYGNLSFVIPAEAVEADRDKLHAMVASLAGDAVVKEMLKLNRPW